MSRLGWEQIEREEQSRCCFKGVCQLRLCERKPTRTHVKAKSRRNLAEHSIGASCVPENRLQSVSESLG